MENLTKIENLIYEIRGKQVMLDSDLAILYGTETKRINEAVKNNLNKFPERFSWKLTNEELTNLWSKFSTANINKKSRSNPRVFTEQGVAMLATILKTKVATQVSIAIMDAFVTMRHYLNSNNIIEHKLLEHDKRISILEDTFNNFKDKNNYIFFNGQIYDAYSKIIDVFNLAKNELIIIDAYADKTVLDMICNLDINVILITRKNTLLKQIDIDKYNKQYNNLSVFYDNSFHDRYFIIDSKEIYHSGTSINNAGMRTFSLNKLEDKDVINVIIDKIKKFH